MPALAPLGEGRPEQPGLVTICSPAAPVTGFTASKDSSWSVGAGLGVVGADHVVRQLGERVGPHAGVQLSVGLAGDRAARAWPGRGPHGAATPSRVRRAAAPPARPARRVRRDMEVPVLVGWSPGGRGHQAFTFSAARKTAVPLLAVFLVPSTVTTTRVALQRALEGPARRQRLAGLAVEVDRVRLAVDGDLDLARLGGAVEGERQTVAVDLGRRGGLLLRSTCAPLPLGECVVLYVFHVPVTFTCLAVHG